MSSHKNQHYVPRCLLKRFSQNNKSIQIYNLRLKRFVSNAPIKHQCSRNFFYGKDQRAEKFLSILEDEFDRIANLITFDEHISSGEIDFLRGFVLTQNARTARSIARMNEFMRAITDAAFLKNDPQRPPDFTHEELVLLALSSGLRHGDQFDDLKLIILQNRTEVDLIISDDPAVHFNRYNQSLAKLKGFGLASSGSTLIMPLSPRYAVFLFDIGVYTVSIPQGDIRVDIVNEADVNALNELQLLNAEQNVYSLNPIEKKFLSAASVFIDKMREGKPIVKRLVPDSSVDNGVLREGSAEEQELSNRLLLQASSYNPTPRVWPEFLKFRKKPITFSDGSAAGEVRKEAWLKPGALD